MTCECRLHIGCPSVRPVLPCVSGAGPGRWLTITFCSSCHPRNDVQIRDMPEQTKTESSRTFLFFSKGGDKCWRSCRTAEYRLNQPISMMNGSVENICAYLRHAEALLSIKILEEGVEK